MKQKIKGITDNCRIFSIDSESYTYITYIYK